MDKKEFAELLKEPKNLDLAATICARSAGVQEIEDLTQYQVPRHELPRVIDDYLVDVAKNTVINTVKRAIAEQHMQKAWIKSLQTLDGWKNLASGSPEKRVMATCQGEILAVTGKEDAVVNAVDTHTTAEVTAKLTKEAVVFKVNGKTRELTNVMMDTQSVVLALH